MTVTVLWEDIELRVAAGDRFAGLFATRLPPVGPLMLSAHLAVPGGIDTLGTALPAGAAATPR